VSATAPVRGLLWLVAREFGRYTPELRDGELRHRLTFRVDGKRYRISGVPLPGGSLRLTSSEMALEVLGAIRADVRAGRSKMQALATYLGRADPANQVRGWVDRWLERQRGRAEAGDLSPTYLRELDRWGAPGGHWATWDGWATWEITYGALEDWSAALAAGGLSAKSRRNVLGGFRSFLGWLERRGDLAVVPRFPRIPVDEHAPTIISLETQAAILAAIPEARRGAFLAMALLGLRPGEVRALDVSDYRDGWLTVAAAMKGPNASAPRRGAKERNARRLPVLEGAPELAAWIERHVDPARRLEGGALFENPTGRTPGRRWLSNSLRLEWTRAARQIGVQVGAYEGTKHAFATSLVARGVPMERVRQILGHRDQRSTERYAKLADQGVVEVLRRKP